MNNSGVSAVWDNAEQTIIRYDVQKSWSVGDLQQALAAGSRLAETVHHPVDVIVNIVKPSLPRLDGFAFGESERRLDAQTGLVVIAANNPIVKNTLLLFLKAHAKLSQVVFVTDTLADARSLVQTQRARRETA